MVNQFNNNINELQKLINLVDKKLPKTNNSNSIDIEEEYSEFLQTGLNHVKKRAKFLSKCIVLTYREKRAELSVLSKSLMSFLRIIKSFYGVYYGKEERAEWLMKDKSTSNISFFANLFKQIYKLDSGFHSFLELSASISIKDYKISFDRYILVKSNNPNINLINEVLSMKLILSGYLKLLGVKQSVIDKRLSTVN